MPVIQMSNQLWDGNVKNGDMLRFAGYPSKAKNVVEYEVRKIISQRFESDANYLEPNSSYPHMHWLTFPTEKCPVPKISGCSGGPVFQITWADNGKIKANWAGLVVTGTVESGRVQFVDAKVIAKSIESGSSD